ncbi:hypothetical protein [Actinokineospora globicatena]|nr:hypothetical protein [Actinokineospora globicatena]
MTWLSPVVGHAARVVGAGSRTERRRAAVHRTILVVDVEAFGDRRRTNLDQVAVRSGLYRSLRQAFREAGVSGAACEFEDRGDGVLVLAPAGMAKGPLVERVPGALARALGEHNATHPAEQRIRLRMALHAGEVNYDRYGVTATAITVAFRLLDAAPLKTALTRSPTVLGVITSAWFYDEVVRHSPVCAPHAYRRVLVSVKETTTAAWIYLGESDLPQADGE